MLLKKLLSNISSYSAHFAPVKSQEKDKSMTYCVKDKG